VPAEDTGVVIDTDDTGVIIDTDDTGVVIVIMVLSTFVVGNIADESAGIVHNELVLWKTVESPKGLATAK
jgi:hypothetical protein